MMITNVSIKMKRIAITGVLGVLGVVGLAACGADAPSATPIQPAATATTAEAAATETPVEIATEMPTSTSVPEATATEAAADETPTEAAVPTDTVEVATATATIAPVEVATEIPTEVPASTATSVPTEEPTEAPLDDIVEPTATTEVSAPVGKTEIAATLKEWAIDMSQGDASAGIVVFNVANAGQFTHNLTIRDSEGNTLGATPTFSSSAGVQTFEVTLAPGTYTVYCSLPGHASRGQQTTLVVK
jgi:hypothetical protein